MRIAVILLLGLLAFAGISKEEIQTQMKTSASLYFDDERTCSVSKIGAATFLTAGHCVKGRFYKDNSFEVHYQNKLDDFPDKRTVKAITAGVLKGDDWAILKTQVDIPDMETAILDCSYNAEVGDELTTVGFPTIMGKSFYKGYVSSVGQPILQDGDVVDNKFFVDVRGAPGSSGSPIFYNGRQVGILIQVVRDNVVGLIATGIQSIDRACASPASNGAGSVKIFDSPRSYGSN